MKGIRYSYDEDLHLGQVRDHEVWNYLYTFSEWKKMNCPDIGVEVDFEPNGVIAKNIVVKSHDCDRESLYGNYSGKSRSTYIALALLLGGHNLWARRRSYGLAQLLLGLTCIGLVVTIPWVIIDTVLVEMNGNGSDYVSLGR